MLQRKRDEWVIRYENKSFGQALFKVTGSKDKHYKYLLYLR